jgi:hypothetical protein
VLAEAQSTRSPVLPRPSPKPSGRRSVQSPAHPRPTHTQSRRRRSSTTARAWPGAHPAVVWLRAVQNRATVVPPVAPPENRRGMCGTAVPLNRAALA